LDGRLGSTAHAGVKGVERGKLVGGEVEAEYVEVLMIRRPHECHNR
jgi:hypothetical protein